MTTPATLLLILTGFTLGLVAGYAWGYSRKVQDTSPKVPTGSDEVFSYECGERFRRKSVLGLR